MDHIIKALMLSSFVSQKMASFSVKPNKEDLQFLKQLIEAIRYLEEGHARGKAVIALEHNDKG